MTVHMVRLYVEPPRGEADEAVNNWVENHTQWGDDPVSHELRETTTGLDGNGTTYVRGDYRFIQNETADELLDGLEDRLQSFQGGLWYRIGHHACDHDEDETTPCSWENTREWGDVPEDIPEFDTSQKWM